jgi:hypothetical protein
MKFKMDFYFIYIYILFIMILNLMFLHDNIVVHFVLYNNYILHSYY